jgi:hypothetical protein
MDRIRKHWVQLFPYYFCFSTVNLRQVPVPIYLIWQKFTEFEEMANMPMAKYARPRHLLRLHQVVAGIEPGELQALLWSRAVPPYTKVLSCAYALFEYTRAEINKKAEAIDYAAAVRQWSLPARPIFNSDEYHVSIAMTILGMCFTRMVDRQVRKRLLAAAAADNDQIRVPDAAIFARFLRESGFRDETLTPMAKIHIGQIVAVVEVSGKVDINADRASLCPPGELAAAYQWPPFVTGLYIQLRLAAEFMESTTLRLALASLGRFQVIFKGQSAMECDADQLAGIRTRLEGRPYASCVSYLDHNFQIGTYPRSCAYGRLVYAKNCTDEAREALSSYDRKGPYKHLQEHEFNLIKMIAKTSLTPAFTAAETAALLETLQLEKAEEYLARLMPDFRATVRQLILRSATQSPIQVSLKEEGGR